MNKDTYTLFSPDENIYYFESKGINGIITKTVIFSPFSINSNLFNLALMDYNENTHTFSDMTNSNNGDITKVLATVALIIHDFLQKNKTATVYFEGNTTTKRNLYNRIIKNNYDYFIENYEIRGSVEEQSELYIIGKQYDGFYILNN